jgi:hypothetical protein
MVKEPGIPKTVSNDTRTIVVWDVLAAILLMIFLFQNNKIKVVPVIKV